MSIADSTLTLDTVRKNLGITQQSAGLLDTDGNEKLYTNVASAIERVRVWFTQWCRDPDDIAHAYWHMQNTGRAEHASNEKPLKILSAGCSTGQEVYSLALLFKAGGIPYHITGLDVSSESIRLAISGKYWWYPEFTYMWEQMLQCAWIHPSHPLDASHGLKGEDTGNLQWSAPEDIRARVRFMVANLRTLRIPSEERFDLIFFRNVLYHLEPSVGLLILRHLLQRLAPKGMLVLGSCDYVTPSFLPKRPAIEAFCANGQPIGEEKISSAPPCFFVRA